MADFEVLGSNTLPRVQATIASRSLCYRLGDHMLKKKNRKSLHKICSFFSHDSKGHEVLGKRSFSAVGVRRSLLLELPKSTGIFIVVMLNFWFPIGSRDIVDNEVEKEAESVEKEVCEKIFVR
jgi:hypothetical protein